MKIILVAGVPASGKSWVCANLAMQPDSPFVYLAHDDYIGANYAQAIIRTNPAPDQMLLVDCPLFISKLIEELNGAGHQVHPYFIVEPLETIAARYQGRVGKPIPKQHLSRQKTIIERAKTYGAPMGTAQETLERIIADWVPNW